MIDIIIPAYNAHETIWQTLFSILYQKFNKNFHVYIVNDASEKDYNDVVLFFQKYMNISEIVLNENGGPAVARQKGIEASKSKYIVFIDSDDVFSDSFALKNLYNEIESSNMDVVCSHFVEETCEGFYDHEDSIIWLHGKIYRRSYIEENKISFNTSRINEDSGFNLLCELSDCKKSFLNCKTYIWRNNNQSITRCDKDNFFVKGINGYISNMLYALKWAIKNEKSRKKIGSFAFNALSTMYIYYLKYQKDERCMESYKMTKKILDISSRFDISTDEKNEIYSLQYNYLLNQDISLKENAVLPKETLYDFVEFIYNLDD